MAWVVQVRLACGSRRLSGVKLLSAHIATTDGVVSCATAPTQRITGLINLEFPGKALMTVEGAPDRESLPPALECLER